MSASISGLIDELQPFAKNLVDAAGAAGLQPRITSTLRSHAEQARLYRRYQQGLQKYPVAPPGTSAHEFGFAFDMVVSPMDAISDVGAYWENLGGVWGGEFDDPIHFEYPGFKASQKKSLAYEVATTAASFAVPFPVTAGFTLARYLKRNGLGWLLDVLPGLAPWMDVDFDALPQWITDILALY